MPGSQVFVADFFFKKKNFQRNIFHIIRGANSLDLNQVRRFIGPDLSPNGLLI